MGRKLTFLEVLNRVHEKSPNIDIVGKYINTKTKTLCKCTQCGKLWVNLLEIKYNIPNELFKPLITKFLNIK